MGGGGGSSFSIKDYNEKSKDSQSRTDIVAFESEINAMLNEKLKRYNDRDSLITNQHLEDIQSIIEEEFEGSIKMKFGGSVTKHTYVEGLSDIDILVLINNSKLSDYSPKSAIKLIKAHLDSKLKDVESIKEGKLAVTVRFSDGTEIQLLPALMKGQGYHIPQRTGRDWSNLIRPDKFAKKITEINQNLNGNVVRVVKLVKGINSEFPNIQQLSGYHIESLAIEIFKKYPPELSKTPKAMLKYFFQKGSELIKTPIRDKTNQCLYVDDYLGKENSEKRMHASHILTRIYKKIERADNGRSKIEWEEFIGEI